MTLTEQEVWKPIDYDIACETVNKLLDEKAKLKQENEQLKKDIRYGFAVDDIVMDRMDKLKAENQQLKELLYKCRKKLDELDYGCEVWQGELTGFIEEIDEVLK